MKRNAAKQIPILFSRWMINGDHSSKNASPSMILDKWNTMLAGKLKPSNINVISFTEEEIQLMISESENDQQTLRSMLIEDLTQKGNFKNRE